MFGSTRIQLMIEDLSGKNLFFVSRINPHGTSAHTFGILFFSLMVESQTNTGSQGLSPKPPHPNLKEKKLIPQVWEMWRWDPTGLVLRSSRLISHFSGPQTLGSHASFFLQGLNPFRARGERNVEEED